jgi:hypothetical protein
MKNVYCPRCGVKLNFQTEEEVDFSIKNADSRVWCIPCQRYIKFSLCKTEPRKDNDSDNKK